MMDKETKLARLRGAAGLTQTQLAEQIGTQKTYISRLERRERPIEGVTLGVATRIARALGVHADDLLEDEGVPHGNGEG